MGTPPDFNTARDRARPELLWYIRHEEALGRWPVLDEPWAQRIEDRRRAENEVGDIAYLHGAGR